MRNLFTLLCIVFSLSCWSQISVNGTSGNLQVANNGPAQVVDEALVVETNLSIPAFRVYISSNYNSGDELSFDASALPATVIGSYNAGVLTFTGSATAEDYQTLLRTVKFSTTSTNAQSRTISFEAGDGTLKHNNGHFYKLSTNSVSWTNARPMQKLNLFLGGRAIWPPLQVPMKIISSGIL